MDQQITNWLELNWGANAINTTFNSIVMGSVKNVAL
jgi:hypothetical protein